MNVVFDTNVLLSATLWSGSVSQKILRLCIQHDVCIFSSEEILAEYQRVVQRDFGYTAKESEMIVETVRSFVFIVVPQYRLHVIMEDPDDNKILESAVESSSKYILTYDKHLLRLGSYDGITILTPELFRHRF